MACKRDRKLRPPAWTPVADRKSWAPKREDVEKRDPEARVGAEAAADAALQRESHRLEVEIERLRGVEAAFEEKHRASLDEFQARYRPGEDPEADADYLKWAHLAEQRRQAQAELADLSERRTPPPPPEPESQT